MPRNGLSARRSASPDTMRSALPLTASSRNLSSVGSRQAEMGSMMFTASAVACIFLSQLWVAGEISDAS
jgi:hypothetical protein